MSPKPPNRPEDIYPELTRDLEQALGDDLLGVCLYGSAAAGRYRKGTSDLNLLILVKDGAQNVLRRLVGFARKWAKARVAPPLVMTPDYIQNSLDVYPVEFLIMSAEHVCIQGHDPLSGIDIAPEHLRLQLEREFKGKLMALKTRLLASGGRSPELKELAREAASAFTALFRAMLKLTTGKLPSDPAQVYELIKEQGIGVEALARMESVRGKVLKLKPGELVTLVEQAVSELEAICHTIDSWQAD
ncbi:MAG: hypothetical protein PVG60_03980 [Desulfarculaceae bacterium]|jgi:predicted nucleotidyltransferase